MIDFESLRQEMVHKQIIRRGIKDKRVISAFAKIDRCKFVSEDLRKFAYEDYPLGIGEGQTVSQPYMCALMTEYLRLSGKEKVLEVGAGSGYQSAVLAELSAQVYSIERVDALVRRSREVLELLGYRNIKIKTGDGALGWKEEAPFERIIITAAVPEIPEPLIEQLAMGGRIVAPVGNRSGQILTILEKGESGMEFSYAGGCVFVPLISEKYGYSD